MQPYRRGWLRGDCPSCGRTDKFGVQLHVGRTNCFVCGYHEPPLLVVKEIEGLVDLPAVTSFLKAFEGITYSEPPAELLDEKPAALPKSFKNIMTGDSFLANLARKQLRKRGFNIRKLALHGVGYCTSGEYADRIIIPFYENGALVYFNARRIFALGSKFKNPGIEEFGVGKSLLIYNIDALKIYRRVYIVESATNALTIGDPAIALGGKIISRYQLSKVLSSPVEECIILLDDDAWEYAVNLALALTPYKKVKVIKMPPGQDVNKIGRPATMKLVKAGDFLEYKQLLKMQKELEML